MLNYYGRKHLIILLNLFMLFPLFALCCCGRWKGDIPVREYPSECLLVTGAGRSPDTLTVSLPGRIDSDNAPVGRNYSERIVFGHMYQPLCSVDCLGEVHPLIADSWRREEGGRLWIFRLRKGIRFWDGSHLTAGDVIRSWRSITWQTAREIAGIDSVTAEGQYSLRVYFDHSIEDFPRILATEHFLVTGGSRRNGFPSGTGRFRPVEGGEDIFRKGTIIRSLDGGRSVIRFVYLSGEEALNRLSGSIDIAVTPDPDLIDYAGALEEFLTIPLPWERTYLLLSATRADRLRSGKEAGSLSGEIRDDLADNAVRVEARGCGRGGWHYDLDECRRLSGIAEYQHRYSAGFNPDSDEKRVLFRKGDHTAAELAGRIAALASSAGSGQAELLESAVPGITGGVIRVEGVTGEELSSSLGGGDDFAYIVSVNARPFDRCAEALELLGKARWLAGSGIGLEDILIPLVDTRNYLIISRAAGPLWMDWRGHLFFSAGYGTAR